MGWVLGIAAVLFAIWLPLRAHAESTLPSPAGWPLGGSPDVIGSFNPPENKWESGHRGVDLAADVGDSVLAAADGTVTFASTLADRGVVVVTHGSLRTTYEPVSAAVSVGQQVTIGQSLGQLESGDHCSVPCLHWGLRQGEAYLDPLSLVGPAKVRLLAGEEVQLAEQRSEDRIEQAKSAALTSTEQFSTTAAHPGPGGVVRPVAGQITSGFGMRFHPVLQVWKLHDGTDFGAACGSPIRSPLDGVVTSAYFNAGYGNRLMVNHGTVTTGFNHASSYLVSPGDQVSAGQVIGYVGTTGYSTGCHLHLMVWVGGQLTDPASWLGI